MAFPTTSVLDAFNRADGALGANWTSPAFGATGTARIASNALHMDVGGVLSSPAAWSASQFGPDVEVYCTMASLTSSFPSVECRLSSLLSSRTGYLVFLNTGGSQITVSRRDNGSTTDLHTYSQAFSAGDSFGMSCVGSTISTYYKPAAGAWTLLGTVTDATYSNAGYVSVDAYASLNAVDDFGGGTIGAASTFVPEILAFG